MTERILLLLEGTIAHIGIDGHNSRAQQARRLATALLNNGHGDQ